MNRTALISLFDHLRREAHGVMHATEGWMQALAEATLLPALNERLSACRDRADRLAAIIDDIRELLTPPPALSGTGEQLDLAQCLEAIVDLLNLTGAPGRLVFPPQSAPLVITQHRPLLEQVLSAVLEASLGWKQSEDVFVSAASAAGGVTAVRIQWKESGGAARIAEWLNAPPEDARFAHPEEVRPGVSLLLAGRRLRSFGGAVQFNDDDAASVTLLLPSIEAAAHPHPQVRADALHILVAEDCDDSFALTRLLLPGEQLERAHTGIEAVAKVKERRFDVIFMDVHMPGMDGYRAIATIRDWETQASNARTPIVILSADDIETQTRSAAQAGCSGYLRKPVRPADMAGVLARVRALR